VNDHYHLGPPVGMAVSTAAAVAHHLGALMPDVTVLCALGGLLFTVATAPWSRVPENWALLVRLVARLRGKR
jgi:hypothetical protein